MTHESGDDDRRATLSTASPEPNRPRGSRHRALIPRGTLQRIVVIYGRLALGAGFLSAVADRFGLWGPFGSGHVAWGDFPRFLRYTATLNPMLPAAVIPAVGVTATVCEIVLGIALIVGIRTPLVSVLSGCLLLLFAAGMTIGTSVKAALDASVFAAAAAAFLLAFVASSRDRP